MNWATGIDENGRPIINPEARYGITGKPALVTPGPLGGHNWQPMSFSPHTGLVYIPAIETAFPYQAVDPKNYTRRTGGFWNIGLDPIVASIPHDEAIRKAVRAASKGRLIAWDPVQRQPEWTIEYPVPWNGGLLSTAGSLLFQGTGQGKFSPMRRAAAASCGSSTRRPASSRRRSPTRSTASNTSRSWPAGAAPRRTPPARSSVRPPRAAPTACSPSSSAARARCRPRRPGRGRSTLPADKPPAKEVFERGLYLYQVNCMICHGDTGVSGGVVPDLRYSAALGAPDTWKSIVVDGTLVNNGMVPFANILKYDEVETIRAYVIQRAHDEKARLAAE